MRLTFASARLAKQCSNLGEMRRKWGNDVASTVARRIKQAESVMSLDDLLQLPGRWERLVADRGGQLSARVSPNHRLIFDVISDTDLRVVRVEDYH